MPFEVLEGPDGKPIAVKATEDGAQRVAVDSVNIDGSGIATEVEQQEQTGKLEEIDTDTTALASTVVLAPTALASDPGINSKISASVTLPVEVIAGQTATATPNAAAQGVVTRLAGITSREVGEGGSTHLDVAAAQVGTWSVDQGAPASPDRAWPVRITGSNGLLSRITGYGEQLVAQRKEIFTFTARPVEDTEVLGFVGTGTHGIDAARRAQFIAVSGVDGESQALQSHTRYPLPPSMPFLIPAAVMFSDAGIVGQTRQIQVGEDDDCFGLEFIGTDVFVFVQSALVGIRVQIPRVAWLDPLDGMGPSGFEVDWTQPNTIEVISGVPGANAGFAAINGIAIVDLPTHMNLAGTLKRSIHPIRARIFNTAPSAPGAIYVRSFSIYALGDFKLPTKVRQAPPDNPVTRTVSTTSAPLIAFRARTTIAGEPYRGFLYPRLITIINKGMSARAECIIYRNPTSLTGASWLPVSAVSGLEYDVSATAANLTSAESLRPISIPAGSSADVDLSAIFEEHLTNLIRNRVDNASDVIVVMARVAIATADVAVAAVFDEVAS